MDTYVDDRHCFVCGEQNDEGLKVEWELDESDDVVVAHFVPERRLQGWKGVVHGGIISTLLDEAMVNYGMCLGEALVSAELSIRFKNPAEIDASIRVEGSARQRKGRMFEGSARCTQGETKVATATSKLMQVDAEVPDVWTKK